MTKAQSSDDEIRAWFAGRIPDDWFTGAPEITIDREEILVVGAIDPPRTEKGASAEATREAAVGRIERFREDTRDKRIAIAIQAERRFRRKVSWGAVCGDVRRPFTTLSVPVMTRLRMAERIALDTLVDAGVARSRSDALAWCVRLVQRHQGEWLDDLRSAFAAVERVRAEGPAV